LGLGFGVQGLGLRVQCFGLGFRDEGLGIENKDRLEALPHHPVSRALHRSHISEMTTPPARARGAFACAP
jgi:hypothetical protein